MVGVAGCAGLCLLFCFFYCVWNGLINKKDKQKKDIIEMTDMVNVCVEDNSTDFGGENTPEGNIIEKEGVSSHTMLPSDDLSEYLVIL
jgi:hypothetical protein